MNKKIDRICDFIIQEKDNIRYVKHVSNTESMPTAKKYQGKKEYICEYYRLIIDNHTKNIFDKNIDIITVFHCLNGRDLDATEGIDINGVFFNLKESDRLKELNSILTVIKHNFLKKQSEDKKKTLQKKREEEINKLYNSMELDKMGN